MAAAVTTTMLAFADCAGVYLHRREEALARAQR